MNNYFFKLTVTSHRFLVIIINLNNSTDQLNKQESRAAASKPRNAAAVLFSLKFADNIHYKLKSSQASKVRLHSSKHIGTKQNLTQNGDSRSFIGVCGKAIKQ